MKWTGMAALAVLALAGVCQANDPMLGGVRMPSPRGPLGTAANWWSRYGEPVNQEAIEAAPARAIPVAPAGWHDHGFGYAFGPGTCDYTAPCTEWLWSGYHQSLCRCAGHSGWHRGGHCGHFGRRHRCGHCGHDDGCGCGKSAGCAAVSDCGHKAPVCEAKSACGCDVADSCCGKRHFHWHWKGLGFWNKHCGCDTCATPCSHEVPVKGLSPKQAPWDEPALPRPLPEAPDHAAVRTHAPLAWPFGPVR